MWKILHRNGFHLIVRMEGAGCFKSLLISYFSKAKVSLQSCEAHFLVVFYVQFIHEFEIMLSNYSLLQYAVGLAWLRLWSLEPKKLQGVGLFGHWLYVNCFNQNCWLEHKKGVQFLVFKVIFLCQNQLNVSNFFFIEGYRIRRITFISKTFWLLSFLKHSVF